MLHFNSVASAAEAQKVKPVEKDFGSWSYQANESGANDVEAAIHYDKKSTQSLKAFVKTNKDLAKQLKSNNTQRLESLVTFKRALSVEEFTRLVAEQNLTVHSYILRMVTPAGLRITITGTPDTSALVPEDKLNREKANVLQRYPGTTLQGVVDAEISFDVKQYDALQAHNEVFLVDVTKTFVRQELNQLFPNADPKRVYVDVEHPYWFMEDLGLRNFQQILN